MSTASETVAASEVASASWQPSFPVRAAFYYPWFPEAWDQHGINPFTRYQPSLGFYDGGADSVIQNHLTAMQYGNISVGIASWWGQGTRTDGRIASLLNAVGERPFRWSVYYEPEGQGDPSVDQIRLDLTYLRDRYASSPAFYRANDKFVVFVYADANDACGTADRWAQANATIGAYVVLKVFSGYRDCASQPNGWHQYAPAVAADAQGQYSYSISPGFHLANEPVRLSRDLPRWNENVRQMVASGAALQLVTTFNEWGEGTSVESATAWASASGFGAYLDALHAHGAVAAPPAASGNLPVATVPRILLSTASRVPGAGVPVAVRWGLASSASGLRRYDLQLKVGSGAFRSRTLASRTATTYRTTLPAGRNYVFRVRAVDRSGRVGAWVYSKTTRPSSISDGSSLIRWSGGWSKIRSSAYLGGSLHATRRRGTTATVTFSGASIAWVGPVGPTRGKAQVFLDGAWVATVNLYRSTFQARRIVFARNFADGNHTLVIKALGTSGHPVVAIDGLYVVNPRTEPAVIAADPVVIAAGDIACDKDSPSFNGGAGTASSCRQRATSDLVLTQEPDVVLPLGDLQYEDGEGDQWPVSYGPSWGRFKAMTRPAVGNHEYAYCETYTAGCTNAAPADGTAQAYSDYFGAAAGAVDKYFYSYDIGTWHLIALNSDSNGAGGLTVGSEQYNWLATDLATHANTCTLAYWHHPRWSSGQHGGTASLAPIYQLLYDRGVDVVLAGHNHHYERTAPLDPSGAIDDARGIRNWVVGTGGRSLRTGTVVPGAFTQAWNDDTFGVLKMRLAAGGYTWQFVPEAGRTYTDSGTGTCH